MLVYFIITIFSKVSSGQEGTEDAQFLNELPLDKLLRLKTSLQDMTMPYENVTSTPAAYLQSFGAQAMAIQGLPIKRGDYDEGIDKKHGHSKISNIFSMSVTTLAFLAFGGYLLCLVVQAVKAKQNQNNNYQPQQPTTFFVSAGIKKKPQSQFTSSYGRRRRNVRMMQSFRRIDLPPEQLFEVLLQLCEGYAKWSEKSIVT